MSAAGQALDLALACYRAPPRLAQAAQRPLPDDMLVLLRLAAGDEALARECADAAHESAGTVVEAAVFFIQQVLFAPGTDSYRALGVNPDAPDARIKEHYRWLVRWLHPDRNPDEWDAIYADRVNRAWQDLRHPDRRAAYDLSLADGSHRAPVGAASAAKPFAKSFAAEAAPTRCGLFG
uniref:J domain-containing protein n=1 Tax=Arenimonas sp. TaxID=1872635 RepID=UPI0035AF47BD